MRCSVKGCTQKHAAMGYCHLHYNRWKRHGDPAVARRMAPRGASVAERLALLTDQSGGPDACHPFTGELHHTGYAFVRINAVTKGLHVWALIEATGEDRSATRDALHSCDNPSCANGRHLRWGTLQENMDDKVARRRQSRLGGERHPEAKLTWSAVRAMRSRSDEPASRLATEFGVSTSLVYLIRNNQRWIEESEACA